MGKLSHTPLSMLVLFGLAPLVAFAQPQVEIGTVVTVQGQLSVRDAAGATRVLERNSAVHEGDVLVVANGAYASLRMSDNAHVSLGPATEFSFQTYRYDGKPGTRDSVVLSLQRGCFRATVGTAGSDARDEYRVETPMASIDVEASLHGATIVEDRLYTATWDGVTVVSNALGSLNLGKYGEYDYSRTLPGAAPAGLAALLPEVACAPPAAWDGKKIP